MFQINEYVIHTTGGICKISAIAPLSIPNSDRKKDYYHLIPVSARGSKVYVPVDCDNAIRKIYTREEALALIDDVPEIEELIIDNEKLRETRYKEVIRSCDPYELVKVLKNLNTRRTKRLEEGKKSTATDDKYFKMAEENLYSELAFVLGMDKADVKDKVFGQIAVN